MPRVMRRVASPAQNESDVIRCARVGPGEGRNGELVPPSSLPRRPGWSTGTAHCCARSGQHAGEILKSRTTSRPARQEGHDMEVLVEICAGLDVHQANVVACVRRPGKRGRRTSEVRTFGTTRREILHLADWLTHEGVTHVAMESTGVFWKPVFNILEGHVEVILVNAEHYKAVPGRKTDVRDCEWLAQLLEHGLLRASFIPPQPIRELRDLTRYRKSLVQHRATEGNRVHKLLESANIKLGIVATDILGASGRAMLRALMAGEGDGTVLAELAKGALRQKRDRLAEALTGRFTPHHAALLGELLAHIEYLECAIARLSERVEAALRPYADHVARLQTIPGVGREAAETIIAEIGVDMSRFPSAAHLASWAGVCPGNNESAGKRKTGKTRKGNRWLKPILVECGWELVVPAVPISAFSTRA